MPAGGTLFVSNSLPVRNLDAFGAARSDGLRVYGNRGASGVDGIVSTAFGVARASESPTACVIGDIALFHDQNGLLWAREPGAAVVFVLIDNDGGGLFHALPVAELEPHFTRLFATPHGLDFRHAATMFGVPLDEVEIRDVGGALERALAAGRTCLLRVRTNRAHNQRRSSEVVRAVVEAVKATLEAKADR
jgi:2-succinyl-5-enolpyruvyl-6-hydroxy-3-cyclohexene-1-carboxylate synthase